MTSQILARAEVGFNGDFFQVISVSSGMLSYPELTSEVRYLEPDADDSALGDALRLALGESKQVSIAEFQKIFASGEIQRIGEERNKYAMKKYSYKSKRAMFRKMMCCWINISENQIQIKPTHHNSIDGYSGISLDGDEILNLPVNATDAELGAALREGFNRCTSAIN
jgi:hypothetical protein